MKTRAAVAWEAGKPLEIEMLDYGAQVLAGPDEIFEHLPSGTSASIEELAL